MKSRVMLVLFAALATSCGGDGGNKGTTSTTQDVQKSQQSLDQGKTSLAAGDLCQADSSFQQSVQSDSANAEARFMRAITHAVKTLIDSVANPPANSAGPTPRDLVLRAGGTIEGSSCDVCAFRVRFPESLPADSPTTSELRDVLTPLLLQQAAAVAADFRQLPGDFEFDDDPAQDSVLPVCLRSSSHLVQIDNGDILAALGALSTSQAVLHVLSAYDVGADVDDTANDRRSPQFVVENNPDLGKRLANPGSSSELTSAGDLLEQGAEQFVQAIDSIRGESGDQSHDLIVFDPAEQSAIDEARRAIVLFGQAISQEVTFMQADFGDDTTHDQRVDLRPFFGATIDDLRPLLPQFNSSGRFDLCAFPDTTFQGMTPDLTQQDINQLLGLPCP